MHPAPSVIAFTVLSGMGFGLMAFLGAGFPAPQGWAAFFHWGLGYGLAVAGLLASTFHLGQPRRALRAFTQWRTSWLSREAWASVATLMLLAPVALSDWLGLGLPRWIGVGGAVMCVVTVICTAMIYAQLATVPRWNHWTTPALFLTFSVAGGAVLAGQGVIALPATAALAQLLLYAFAAGDRRFAGRGHSVNSATGLAGGVTVFERGHTGGNYLLREMIHVVGRRHAIRLRIIAIAGAGIIPAVLLALLPATVLTYGLAALIHLAGALAARWLFFAEAEHVVGLYYGRHSGQ